MEQTRSRLVRVSEHRGRRRRAASFETRAAVLVLQGQELAGLLAFAWTRVLRSVVLTGLDH
jgi:hypothetical protein